MKFVLFICIGVVVKIFIKIYMRVTCRNKLKKAVNFSDKGENIKAIDIYSNIIDSHGKVKRAKGYVYRGNCYLKMGRYIDALHDLSDSIRVVQIPDINMVSMGDFFYAVKKYNMAFKYFSKAVKFKPKSSMTHLSLGLFYYRTKQYNKAIESFDTALEYRHNKSIIYAHLGATYIKLKDYDKAGSNLLESLEIKPGNCAACISYANLLRIEGDFSQAKEYILKGINTNAHEYRLYKILAKINLMEDNYIEFYENFKIFLDKKPLNFDYKELKDSIYDKVRNEDKFKSLIEKKVKNINPFNDLNCFIDDDRLLSYKRYKKQRRIYHIRKVLRVLLISLFVLIMLLIILIVFIFHGFTM